MSFQENSIGAKIIYTVIDSDGDPLDISGASSKKLVFKKPDGTFVEKTALFAGAPDGIGDGTDGKLLYTTVEGDLTPSGTWEVQADVVKANIMNGRSEVKVFDVCANLK